MAISAVILAANGHGFQHHGKGARLGHRFGVGLDGGPFGLGTALRLEAAVNLHPLGRHADMAHHRDAPVGQVGDGLGHAHAAFQLDRLAAGFVHHPGGIAERHLRALLIGAERHVDHHQGPLGAAHHRLAVQDHHVERDGERIFQAVDDVAQAVADQHQIDMVVEQTGGVSVVAGQAHDGLTAGLVGDNLGNADPFGFDHSRH
jgi:hypothetical protein